MSFYKITRCLITTKKQPFVPPYSACHLAAEALQEKGIPCTIYHSVHKPLSRSRFESQCPECLENHKLHNCECKDNDECIEKMPKMIFRYFNNGTEIGMKCEKGCRVSSILRALFDNMFISLT